MRAERLAWRPRDVESAKQPTSKYARSGANFARIRFRKSFKWLAAHVAKSGSLPLAVLGRALKTWRSLVYSEAL